MITDPKVPSSRPCVVEQGSQPLSLATRLGWVSFFNDCSSEVIARALPLFLTSVLGATPAFVGAVEGFAEAVSIILKGFSGWLSDRLPSRKPLVVFGYSFSVLSRVLLLAAHVPILVGFARVFDRTGKGLRSAPRDALVADGAAAGRAGRDFGITRFLDTLGAVTGILLILAMGVGSGPMTALTFRKIVLLALPPGVISIILLVLFIPRVERNTSVKTYISWHIPKEIRVYLLLVAIFSLGNSSDAFLVLRASELGFSFRDTLIVLVLFNLLAAGLAVPVGRLSDRYGRTKFLCTGWLVYAATYFFMGRAASREVFAAACLAYGAFYGFTEGVEKALLADLLPKERRGTGFGALQLVLGLAALPASVLTGTLMTNYGSAVAFTVSAAFALMGAAGLLVWAMAIHLKDGRP